MAAWCRRQWRVVPVLGAAVLFDAGFNELVEPSSFIRGLLDGVLLGVSAATLFVVAAVASGSWPKLWGWAGETFTADEFTRRRRRQQGWRIFHGIRLSGHEIDHIAVGPGGILAIETKWVGSGRWRVTEDGLTGPIRDPLAQARISREKADSFLRRSVTGGRLPVDVQAVLVVWGPGCPAVDGGHVDIDGVRVFSGHDETAWRRWLDIERVDRELVEAAAASLQRFVRGTASTATGESRSSRRTTTPASVGP